MRKLNSSLFLGVLFLLILTTVYAADERSITIKPKEKRDLSVETKKGVVPALLNIKYHALIIGNNNYKHLPKLKTAIADAKSVDEVLKSQYGFETKLLIDATRKDILSTINDLRKRLGEKDNLLIYYAGHGTFEKAANKAYWLPVDAQKDDNTDWIIVDDITSNIKIIASRHILIVSDSCYAGTMVRSISTELSTPQREEFIKKMMERKSRTLMASGGNEPVVDEGGSGHSVFADALLKALKESDKNIFTAEELFYGRVKIIVAGKSEQVPEYNDIRNSGHEGGDFVFQVKTASLGAVSTPAPPPSPALSVPTPPPPVVLQGHLQVNVNAPSAMVYVNGEDKGTASPGSPLNMENLSTGTVSIRVEAEGYESLQRTVTIQRNQWTQEVFELKRIQIASLPSPQPPIQPQTNVAEKGNMVLIPAGEFVAGNPFSLKGMFLSVFYIDKYEVTQSEFQQVMGKNPSKFKGCDNCPVESVTWFEADEYCRKVGKRLPTEWEWEKAAKAGTTTKFYWGKSESLADDYAWYRDNSENKTHPVGQKKPNAYGLYDMAGNVWEWVEVVKSAYVQNSRGDLVVRGGSWYYSPNYLWSSIRTGAGPSVRRNDYGFRCVSVSP
jgi:formylglycine-generating enzyme required for sulfatase activity/uncharacterized caspase-like protein